MTLVFKCVLRDPKGLEGGKNHQINAQCPGTVKGVGVVWGGVIWNSDLNSEYVYSTYGCASAV